MMTSKSSPGDYFIYKTAETGYDNDATNTIGASNESENKKKRQVRASLPELSVSFLAGLF